MKKCFKCSRCLPLSEFYRHAQMGDGHLNKCKECAKADVKATYRRRMAEPLYQDCERRRGRDKYRRLYTSPGARALANARERQRRRGIANKYRAVYPDKYRAHSKVGSALKSGKLHRRPCEVCSNPRADAHHDDYSKPLDVRWLCRRHHHDVHLGQRQA